MAEDSSVHVKKVNGKLELFSKDKIIASCLNAGTTHDQAEDIASEILKNAYSGMTTSEIRANVFKGLSRISKEMADKYMYRLHMSVRTSQSTLENFDTPVTNTKRR